MSYRVPDNQSPPSSVRWIMIQIVTWLTAIIAVVVGLFFVFIDLGRYPPHVWLGVIDRELASSAGTASLFPLMLYLPCAVIGLVKEYRAMAQNRRAKTGCLSVIGGLLLLLSVSIALLGMASI